MAKKKNETKNKPVNTAHIEGAGEIVKQPITQTLEHNYMPYAMSVILSRAIPEIDGFKPSHRKLLYMMYKMGLLTGGRTKSANIVGRTMQLNPHGDVPIYETMVRLSKGYEALLHPYVDSKGNFGKTYSKDMVWAASRYTEAKLAPIAAELFANIDKDTVDFIDNYDNTMKEPILLPVTFPSVLVNANTGIAVGMASSICSFNLKEVCQTTIELMDNPDHIISDTLLAPDFSGGGDLLYDREVIEQVYETGRGIFRVRAKYEYDKRNRCIDITEIPPTTTVEAIVDKIIDRVKANEIRDISDVRDETDKSGLRITIDLKRGVDPDQLMKKLYAMTSLEDSFACNFNVLIAGAPRVVGIKELLNEWIAFRIECVKRRVYFDLEKSKNRLHLLEGLKKILLDIDKAVKIVRETTLESEVVPNLMIGFGIDEIQAEYVAEIKLRHLNREYILKRTDDIEQLKQDIADMEDILKKRRRVEKIIKDELKNVMKKYGQERKTNIVYAADIEEIEMVENVPDYPVVLFFTKEGYFKKITPQSLRMSGAHVLKENDEIILEIESFADSDLLFFTNKANVYKAKAYEFEDTKASVLGDYVATELEMEQDETAIYMVVTREYDGYMVFAFENGKLAKVELSAYETKTNRKRLINAFSERSPLVGMVYVQDGQEIVLQSTDGRVLLVNTAVISAKSSRNTIGVNVMRIRKGYKLQGVSIYKEGQFSDPNRYLARSLPVFGKPLHEEDLGEQLSFTSEA